MTSIISYWKAVQALRFAVEDSMPAAKDPVAVKSCQELKTFADLIRSQDSYCRLFRMIMDNLSMNSPKNAIFFAEKLMTLMDKNPIVVYIVGECYFANSDWLKVFQLFQNNRLLYANDNYLVLAAKAMLNNKQYSVCESLINKQTDQGEVLTNNKLKSAKLFTLARCQEVLEKKKSSTTNYLECLKSDPTNAEALALLMDSYLISLPEKEQFLNNVQFSPEDSWIKKFYFTYVKDSALDENKNMLNMSARETCKINQFQLNRELFKSSKKNENAMDIESEGGIVKHAGQDSIYESLVKKDNLDILCIKAKKAFMRYDIQTAYALSKQVFAGDPLKLDNLSVYAACLLETQNFGDLYSLCYLLTENYSDHPVTYYVVGMHYFLSRNFETARKFFKKSNSLDKNFIYSWIAIGHSFAIQDESDHAMSVYRTCTRLFPGSHLPHLYIGMENLRTNSLSTAQLNFQASHELSRIDPMVLNELGVTYYKRKMYGEAKETFVKALELSSESESWVKETILCNIGHSYRKAGDTKSAIAYFEKGLSLNPWDGSLLFALAFTYHVSYQLNKAIQYYNKMIEHQPDNMFAKDMMDRCLADLNTLSLEDALAD